jgi:uncharacterized protein YggE
MRTYRCTALSFSILAIVIASVARADDVGAASVTANGHATLKHAPELMRARVVLRGDGKDAHEAMDNLNHRRSQVKEKLLALGAVARSLDLGQPGSAGDQLTPQQRQMQMVMAMQRNQHPTTQPQGVSVVCTVQAEWPLSEQPPDDAYITATDLQAKITAGIREGAAKHGQTPEEQEIAEEMAAAASNDGSDNTAGKPNEPSYVFVHKLTDEELAKLSADAVSSARADAHRLATAAGVVLGNVIRISTSPSTTIDDNPYAAYLQAYAGNDKPARDDMEATSTGPGQVTYSVQVTAVFAAK